jgi:hypothetical protein
MADALVIKKSACGGTYKLGENMLGQAIVYCSRCGVVMSKKFYDLFVVKREPRPTI